MQMPDRRARPAFFSFRDHTRLQLTDTRRHWMEHGKTISAIPAAEALIGMIFTMRLILSAGIAI